MTTVPAATAEEFTRLFQEMKDAISGTDLPNASKTYLIELLDDQLHIELTVLRYV